MLERMRLPVEANQTTADGLMCIPLAVQKNDVRVAIEVSEVAGYFAPAENFLHLSSLDCRINGSAVVVVVSRWHLMSINEGSQLTNLPNV